jgi:hypothetical protein
MEHVLKQTTADHRTLLIGDTNSAPSGGRWGYSPASYTKHADRIMADWVSRCNLQEILSVPLRPTWRAQHFRTQAALDRVFSRTLTYRHQIYCWIGKTTAPPTMP